jgi:hypothetical protein
MKNKKLVAIPLLIAIALSIFGFTYAHWSDKITIDGTVHMGSLTLAFGNVPPIEPPSCLEYYEIDGVLYLGEYKGKDVGSCSASYSGLVTDEHTEKYGYDTLNILVNNAYPQYYVRTTFRIHNIGTIPIDLAYYEITGEKRDSTGKVIYNLIWYVPDPTYPYKGSLWEDVNGNKIKDAGDIEVINLEITNDLPIQLEPCHDNKEEIDMDFKQGAEECHTYTIHVTAVGIQFNKWP